MAEKISKAPKTAVAPVKGQVAEVLAVLLPQAPTPPRVKAKLNQLETEVTQLKEDVADPAKAKTRAITSTLLGLLDRTKPE